MHLVTNKWVPVNSKFVCNNDISFDIQFDIVLYESPWVFGMD